MSYVHVTFSSARVYSNSVPVTGKWYCLELYWQMSASGGRATLWVNGVQAASISGVNTASYGAVTEVRFGIAEAFKVSSSRKYGDSAVVSDRYIGLG